MSYQIGPKIGIEGESEFRQQIKDINMGIKTLGTEMKAVTSVFSGQEKSVQSLSAENDVLGRTVYSLQEKLELQKRMLRESANAYGEASEKTQGWQQQVNLTSADLNNAKAKIAANEQAIRDLKEETDGASKSTSVFSEVLKANLLSDAIYNGVKRLASGMKDFVMSSLDAAADLQASRSQFTQTFGDMEQAAHDAVAAVAKETGILETRLNKTATGIYAFAKSSGATTEDAMGLMETALRAAADSAAYYDRSLEETSETLKSFLKGNYANDAALGVSATETTRNAKAMELFGKKFADLSEIQKQQTLLKMVTDAQELSGALGQASREMDGWANVTGNLKEVGDQIKAGIGAPLLEMIIPALQEATEFGQKLVEETDWSGLITMVSAVGSGFATWKVVGLITSVVGAIKGFIGAAEGASVAQAALNAVMAANPIGIVVTAIVALVAAFVTAYKTNDEFREKVDAAWDAIKSKIQAVTDWIKQRMDELREFFGLEGGSVNLTFSGSPSGGDRGGGFGTSGGGFGSFGGTVNNFVVDDIRTYQQIEQRAVNQQRTTRMGYVGG